MATTFIYRIDHHGSLVRPTELLAAQRGHAAGTVSDADFGEVEDELVREGVKLQRIARLTEVTDGHYRRSDFRDGILANVTGFERTNDVESDGLRVWRNVGEVAASDSTLVARADEIHGMTSIPTKVTIPSPAYLAAHTWQGGSSSPYSSAVELGMAIAAVVHGEIAALIAAGVPYVQLDNPDLSAYYAGSGFDLPQPAFDVLEAIAIDDAGVESLERPENFRLGLAVDWGQYLTTEADEQVAWEVFNTLPFDRFLIPFQSDQFVEQQLVQFIPKGVAACLGIVDATVPELEDVDVIIARIEKAFELKHPDEVALSPSKGFQDAAYVPAVVTVDQERRILTHVETIARMVYGGEL